MSATFDDLIRRAIEQDFSGWDFSALQDRWQEHPPTWSYREQVKSQLADATSLLDMGTGGGEFLSSLEPLPLVTCATEGYAPNIPIAKKRLQPLGVDVWAYTTDAELPFDDNSFDLIINRHESFDAAEVFRILKPGGHFITQQVGGRDNIALNYWLQDRPQSSFENWQLTLAADLLADAGFDITDQQEEFPQTVFHDVGAVISYLRAIPWQIPDFDPKADNYRDKLLTLHQEIEATGGLVINSHRFLVVCEKPRYPDRPAPPRS